MYFPNTATSRLAERGTLPRIGGQPFWKPSHDQILPTSKNFQFTYNQWVNVKLHHINISSKQDFAAIDHSCFTKIQHVLHICTLGHSSIPILLVNFLRNINIKLAQIFSWKWAQLHCSSWVKCTRKHKTFKLNRLLTVAARPVGDPHFCDAVLLTQVNHEPRPLSPICVGAGTFLDICLSVPIHSITGWKPSPRAGTFVGGTLMCRPIQCQIWFWKSTSVLNSEEHGFKMYCHVVQFLLDLDKTNSSFHNLPEYISSHEGVQKHWGYWVKIKAVKNATLFILPEAVASHQWTLSSPSVTYTSGGAKEK